MQASKPPKPDLNAALLRQLTHHHIATDEAPVPQRIGVSWVWAGNGLFKYGRNQHTEGIVQLAEALTPGLPLLAPAVAWDGWEGRLPGRLLVEALEQARKTYGPKPLAGAADATQVPIEAQFLVVLGADGVPALMQPPQEATPGRVCYLLDGIPFLMDIHSHHRMEPFFSPTDDTDDTWLTASVVMGRIFDEQPQLIARLNVYGHRQMIPAALLFDDLVPFVDVGRTYFLNDTAESHAHRGEPMGLSVEDRAAWWAGLISRKILDERLDLANDEDAKELLWFVSQALNWVPAAQDPAGHASLAGPAVDALLDQLAQALEAEGSIPLDDDQDALSLVRRVEDALRRRREAPDAPATD